MSDPDLAAAVASLTADDLPDDSVEELALGWPRDDLSAALLAVLDTAPESVVRERAARLLKRFLVPEQLDVAVSIMQDPQASPVVRRWIVEALDRLAYTGAVGWIELSGVVDGLVVRDDAASREGLLGLLMSLPWRDRSAEVFIASLGSTDPLVVAAAANGLRWHPEAVARVDPAVWRRLRAHPNDLVRRAVAEVPAPGSSG